MKKKLMLLAYIMPCFYFSQVGINTTQPKASLHIEAGPQNKPDGILIPRISGDSLRLKSDLYTEEQDGVMVYITSADSNPQGKTIDVLSEGFYFYQHSKGKWVKLNGTNGSTGDGLWKKQREAQGDPIEDAYGVDDNVFRMGSVAIGTDGLTTVQIPQSVEGGYAQVTYPSSYELELRGNYSIRSGENNPDNPSIGTWYIDQLMHSESLSYMDRNSLRLSRGESQNIKDPLLNNTQLFNNLKNILNGNLAAKQSPDRIPTARIKLFGEVDNMVLPLVGLLWADINLNFRRSYSFTYEEPYSTMTRVWNFKPNVMNSTTIGYADGIINLQTLRVPEIGEPWKDETISMSRIMMEKPYNHENFIAFINQNRVLDIGNDEYSRTNLIKLDKNGVTFFAINYDLNIQPKSDSGYYTFPRTAPATNNVYLGYGKNKTDALTWNPLPVVFNNSYGELETGLYPTIYTVADANAYNANDRIFNVGNGRNEDERSDAFTILKSGLATLPSSTTTMIDDYTSGKAIVTKEYLESKLPNPRSTMTITVPAPPSDGTYTLVSENGQMFWKKIDNN